MQIIEGVIMMLMIIMIEEKEDEGVDKETHLYITSAGGGTHGNLVLCLNSFR